MNPLHINSKNLCMYNFWVVFNEVDVCKSHFRIIFFSNEVRKNPLSIYFYVLAFVFIFTKLKWNHISCFPFKLYMFTYINEFYFIMYINIIIFIHNQENRYVKHRSQFNIKYYYLRNKNLIRKYFIAKPL